MNSNLNSNLSALSNTCHYKQSTSSALESDLNRKAPRILWIDGVGGYLLIDRDQVLIGQATAGCLVDIGIVGDLSRQAAVIRRSHADYLIEPMQETFLDGVLITQPQLLRSGAQMQWGSRVKLQLIKPHPLSSTARLNLTSHHRFQPRVDGVLLLADSCILGPGPNCHVHCPQWGQDLLMFSHAGQWYFRTMGEVEVDGQTQQGQIPIRAGMRMRGLDFSLSVE